MQTYLRKYGAEATINFVLYDTTGAAFKTDAVHAAGDLTRMADEGAEGAPTNGFTDEGIGYSLVLTAAEMQAARVVIYVIDQGTKVWLDTAVLIETYGHASAQHAFDLGTASIAQTGDAYAAVGSLNDFDPASDAVAHVTLVDTTTDLTNAPTDMATATALATVDTVVDAIKAKTDTIGASSVTVTSPVVSNNTIQLVQGDDYAAADSRQLDFTYSGQPSFTGGAVKMRFVHQGGTRTLLEISGTVTAADTVRFTPTAAETAQLSPGRMAFEIEVTLASGRVITPTALSTGTANILAQAAG